MLCVRVHNYGEVDGKHFFFQFDKRERYNRLVLHKTVIVYRNNNDTQAIDVVVK